MPEVITIRNLTAGALTFNQLALPNRVLPALSDLNLTDWNRVDDILNDVELFTYITNDQVSLLVDSILLSKATALRFLGSGGDIVGTTAPLDTQIVVFDGTSGFQVKPTSPTIDGSGNLVTTGRVSAGGGANLGPSATDPVSGVAGDVYYNTVLKMLMEYDASRSKWLSVDTAYFLWSRSGATAAGSYFQVGGVALTTTLGFVCHRNGTIVEFSYTRSNTTATTLQITEDGTPVYSLASSVGKDKDVSVNVDVGVNSILGAYNASGGGIVQNIIGNLAVKWRI